MKPHREVNVVAFLEQVNARAGARPALIAGPRVVSFGELWERVRRTAGGLRAAGLRPGERVVLMVPMSIETLSILRGGGSSRVRTTQTYSGYRRFVAESRIVK